MIVVVGLCKAQNLLGEIRVTVFRTLVKSHKDVKGTEVFTRRYSAKKNNLNSFTKVFS